MNTEVKRTPPIEPLTELPQHQTARKRWKLTRADNQDPARRTRNTVIDMAYMHLVGKVKALYLGSGTVAFERDLRDDRTFTTSGMHCFCTADLYLELECGYDLLCLVKYDFEDCQHEAYILSLLHSIYPLKTTSKPYLVEGGVGECFKAIQRLHKPEYFTHL